MPKKVPFKVVYCSGWEDDYSPKDLEVRVELEVLTNFKATLVVCFCCLLLHSFLNQDCMNS